MPEFSVDLKGQSALVAGAGAGYGRAIALALARNGAKLAAADLNIERAEATAEEVAGRGGAAIAIHADVANRFQVANMIERTRDAFGGIQILVNAARAFRAEPMLKIDEWDWRRQIEVNLTGAFFCTQLVGRVMADEGGGSIIHIVSADALRSTIPEGIGYIASGAGIVGMTRQAARELAAHNVRVNAIATGARGGSEAAADGLPAGQSAAGNPPSDAAGAALFLSSDAAKSISGQVIVVDGGHIGEST